MKKLISFISLFILIACQSGTKPLVVKGEVEGLEPGDTIFLTYFELPDWEELEVDTFYVMQPNEFTLQKHLEHTSFLMLNHHPKDKPKIISCSRGGTFLAQPGDLIEMQGSTQLIGALEKKGGFYNDSLITRMDKLDNEHLTGLNDIYLQIEKYRNGDENLKDSLNKYVSLYQQFSRSEELKDLQKHIRENIQDNEYSAYLYLSYLHDVPYQQLYERLNKFTPEIRSSYMGQRLDYMQNILKNIEIGNTPADFTVTDKKGNSVKLADYRGKYLLLYHWGMCPGTIWVQPKLLELYESYNTKGFEILGFTPNDFDVEYAKHREVEELKPLFDQPWTTVITKQEGNEFIEKELYFAGVPILMLISPEGVTLTRGYSDAYQPTKKIMEEAFANL